VLIWDSLEYLSPPLLTAVVDRLHKIVRPKSYMLSFFHADDKMEAVPSYTFRIQSQNSLHVTQHGTRRPAQLFNNRSLEKLFARYESVKVFPDAGAVARSDRKGLAPLFWPATCSIARVPRPGILILLLGIPAFG
jgi:hypothetical protein